MRSFIHRYRLLAGGLALVSLALAAVIAFQLGLGLRDEKPVAAEDPVPSAANSDATPTPLPTFPGHEITPAPGATPDMSQPFWWVPYRNADRMAPKFTGEIAGITIDPAQQFGPSCASREEAGTDEEAGASVLALDLSYLPDGSVLTARQIAKCEGELLYNTFDYDVEQDPQVAGQGGYFRVSRWKGPPGASFAFSAGRWEEGEISGRTAAIGHPILPVGVGESVVLVHEDGVMTMVHGVDMPIEELIAVTVGLYQ